MAIECQNVSKADKRLIFDGGCTVSEAVDFMCQQHGFCAAEFELHETGTRYLRQGNIFFAKAESALRRDLTLWRTAIREAPRRSFQSHRGAEPFPPGV